MKEFKVAVAQMDIKLEDKEANLKKTAEMVSTATKQEADFVCLPEYLTTGSALEQCSKLAEPIPGHVTDRLRAIAKENGVYLVASIPERTDDKIYNTAVLIDPRGEVLTKYRKIHLFMEERNHIARGGEYVVADTEFGKVGLMICYDAVFPEIARQLALQGADIVFMPANWPNPFLSQWRLATSARALDNQFWLVATNRIGADSKFTYSGGSRVINPYGDPVVECGDKEEILVATVDGKVTEEFKRTVNFLNDRHSEVYK
ncbi:MAG: carbon-nitrogen hydrolase family protein [Candidatus Aenigmatarchaeota archaeon]